MLDFNYTKIGANSPIPAIKFYFKNPENALLTISESCSILDTGSDVIIIPYSIASKLYLKSFDEEEPLKFRGFGRENKGVPYRVAGSFDDNNYFRTKVFAVPDDVLNSEVIIGRNILNRYVITFNDPGLTFTISD
jgi:predicted aspartyl protease